MPALMSILEASLFNELFVSCAVAIGLSAAILIQCGSDKRATAKKKVGSGSSKSKRASSKSVKTAKSKRDNSKRSSKRSARAQDSRRKLKLSAQKAGQKVSDASQKAGQKVSDASQKTARSIKNTADSAQQKARSIKDKVVKEAKEIPPKIKSEAEKLTNTRSKQQEPAIKSLQDTQKSRSQKRSVSSKRSGSQNLEFTMEPRELRFNEQGGFEKVYLHNPTDELCAFKVKCSDNNLYRVNPVFGLIGPHEEVTIDVLRQNGGSKKLDKIVFVLAKAPAENVDAKQLFKTVDTRNAPKIALALMA